ncbi:hypothetical protein NUW54_g13753 [Trametes sanguinea]|uniref:Uncharacterized protein n=1 Tax=Trametes sanguinea TaxID=158606 RepID=A0ACC1MJ96_9APHY|nr:hypothetical protein NUW54_g13753 [Trametes sanguinea]
MPPYAHAVHDHHHQHHHLPPAPAAPSQNAVADPPPPRSSAPSTTSYTTLRYALQPQAPREHPAVDSYHRPPPASQPAQPAPSPSPSSSSQAQMRHGVPKWLICAGLALSSIGFGLMMLMSRTQLPRGADALPPNRRGGPGDALPRAVPGLHARASAAGGRLRDQRVLPRAVYGRDCRAGMWFFPSEAVAGAVFLGRLSNSLPPDVDGSVVLESVVALRARSDWPDILHALASAIKVGRRLFLRRAAGERCFRPAWDPARALLGTEH